MENYPEIATERFDKANFHIKYCLSLVKNYIKGDVLEVGAGCGSFTRNYEKATNGSITLTELDEKNLFILKKNFKENTRIKVFKDGQTEIGAKYDTILYFHVLEHIENDTKELEKAKKMLNRNGHLIIMAPAHQKIYSNLDKAVGHFRRYEKSFFSKDLFGLEQKKLILIDSIGYVLYFLNKTFFKNEVFPSDFKIFIWDKIFTPFTIIVDFLTIYKFGKCFISIYKKN
tara:strand:+ start:139 stop:825 length:687 start_codon:yes stop_codon:yes gene_type:complete